MTNNCKLYVLLLIFIHNIKFVLVSSYADSELIQLDSDNI